VNYRDAFKKRIPKPATIQEHELEWIISLLVDSMMLLKNTEDYEKGNLNVLPIREGINFLQSKKDEIVHESKR